MPGRFVMNYAVRKVESCCGSAASHTGALFEVRLNQTGLGFQCSLHLGARLQSRGVPAKVTHRSSKVSPPSPSA